MTKEEIKKKKSQKIFIIIEIKKKKTIEFKRTIDWIFVKAIFAMTYLIYV